DHRALMRDSAAPMRLAAVLTETGQTVSTAESLTGGLLAAQITVVPGSSNFMLGGVVAYQLSAKQRLLGVRTDRTISAECAEQMAVGIRERTDSTWALATTGVAGPDEWEGQPVGTVYLGLAGPDGVAHRLLSLAGSRKKIRALTCTAALE